ncbi:hypothetical protein BD779DRAFT_1042910 [Infundibulicybe gibba]|nr:hypothetical protein BD779DRAFT_1042910 [Infundibulicybe gibba]
MRTMGRFKHPRRKYLYGDLTHIDNPLSTTTGTLRVQAPFLFLIFCPPQPIDNRRHPIFNSIRHACCAAQRTLDPCHSLYTPHALKGLKGVNHLFYAAAQQVQFRDVKMYNDSNWTREIAPLRDPNNARYVKSLIIDPYLIQEDIIRGADYIAHSASRQNIIPRGVKRLAHYATAPFRIFRRQKHPPPQISAADLKVMHLSRVESHLEILQALTNLEECTIFYKRTYYNYHAPRLQEVWPAFAPSLRKLELAMPVHSISSFIPPTTIQFNNLRILSLHLMPGRGWVHPAPSTDCVQIYQFTNSLRTTLEELRLYGSIGTPLDWFLDGLGYFECLRAVTIVDVPAALDFLNKHRKSIRHLSLIRPTRSFLQLVGNFQLEGLDLPHLNSLTISQCSLAADWDQTGLFIQGISHSLTELSIQDTLQRAELLLLLRYFSTNRLEKLTLCQPTFDADLVITLAIYLPLLHSLTLHVENEHFTAPIGANTQASANPDTLTSWKLCDITITRCASCKRPVLWTVMALVAMCVPSVTSFCGNGHTRIPDPAKAWPVEKRWQCRGDFCRYYANI